jgi:hypothetical protein
MANLPRSAYSLNGGLAFQGAPAHGNVVARELESGPAPSQVAQSAQQEATRQGTRAEALASQMAASAKNAMHELLLRGNSGALPGMSAIAANPELVANIGLS